MGKIDGFRWRFSLDPIHWKSGIWITDYIIYYRIIIVLSTILLWHYDYYLLYYWLVVWNIFYFPIYWEFHHPNWRSHIVQRGGYTGPPTRLLFLILIELSTHGYFMHSSPGHPIFFFSVDVFFTNARCPVMRCCTSWRTMQTFDFIHVTNRYV